jgi:actin-like ATPase involved in cell morphogenesis
VKGDPVSGPKGWVVTGVTVVVDFGSAHTVVAAGPPDRLVTVVPSVVLLSQDDQLLAGQEAIRLAAEDPSRLLTRLKTRLDEREVLVGDIVLPVTGLLRALLSRAVRSVDEPVAELVLTHPCGWPTELVAVLTRAAAGLARQVTTLPAPVAAAAGAGIEPGVSVAVVDFGATSCEVAVVRRTTAEYEVLAHGSISLGGDDLDDRVFDHLGGDVDARVHKERVVATGEADGLTAETLERLIAGDVTQVAELVARVTAEAQADLVVLVGGSSRVPMVGRLVAEAVPRPVRLAPDPEHAVALGALRLGVAERPVPMSAALPVAPPPPLRPGRRRVVVAAALVVFALAAAAVAVVGVGPGQLVAGLPGPADFSEPSEGETELPPEVAGNELVSAGQTRFQPGRMGTPVRVRHTSGTTLELTLTGLQAQRRAVAPFEDAPLGYRWVTVLVNGVNVGGVGWREDLEGLVAALDDRGQWIRPLDGAGGGCSAKTGVPETVGAGAAFEACVMLAVPEATPVTSVVFGELGGPSAPFRFPVSAPPVAGAEPAPFREVGLLGEPAVGVEVNGLAVRAGFHVVLTPSGYLGTRRPAPGNRYVVVRAQLPALSASKHVYLRDDRGVLTQALSGFDSMPTCPPFGALGDPGTLVYACFVYELDADAPVAGVTLGGPLDGAGRDVEAWPTWTTP